MITYMLNALFSCCRDGDKDEDEIIGHPEVIASPVVDSKTYNTLPGMPANGGNITPHKHVQTPDTYEPTTTTKLIEHKHNANYSSPDSVNSDDSWGDFGKDPSLVAFQKIKI